MDDEVKEFNDNQKEVINFGKGTLLVEAGPGSGKTTVIVERIRHLIQDCNVSPETFLVITFTRKAAQNLQNKLKKSLSKEIVDKMQISTIHSFCFEFLKNRNQILNLLDDDSEEKKALFIQKHKKDLGFTGAYTVKNHHISAIIDKFEEYTNFNVNSEGLIKYLEETNPIGDKFINFANENEYFSNKKGKECYKEDWYNARYQQVARAYPKYLELLDENSLVDYNTLQLKTFNELESNPETPYTTILIDEFQDTDPLQFEIFKILRKNAKYFTVVGDVDQRIYSFRSTFKDYFKELENEPNTTRISLDYNYRSTKNIVEITDKFIEYQRDENSLKDLKAFNDVEWGGYDNPTFIIETEMPKKRAEQKQAYDDEAKKIFEIIKDVEKYTNAKYDDIAVLYRKHSSQTIGNLINYLNEANIPFSIRGRSDLENQKEVKAIILMLWYITRKLDDSYISSKDEFIWLNLKGFCDKNLEGAFWCLTDTTKEYLTNLQETFEKELIRIRKEETGKLKVITTIGDEDEDTLIKIFKQVKKPEVDLNQISEEDRYFFEKLECLRDKTEKREIEILKVYYELLSLCDYFENVDEHLTEVLNLATFTQSMSNYEEYISKTDVRGLYFFLTRSIKGYSSNYEDKGGIQLMTVHAAKGLEFPVTIVPSLQKDEFPMKLKDENRTKSNIDAKDTYYTPNKFLRYKCVNGDENNAISIEEENEHQLEEEERVVYVAMTRAADLLILSCLGENPCGIKCIKSDLKAYNIEDLKNVTIEKDFKNQDDDEPIVLNYSKYTKFLLCPFKFNLGYNLGFRRPGAKAANRGTVFHRIMEEINLKLKKGEVLSIDKLSQITYDFYKSMFNIEETPEEFEEFKKKVINYYETFSKNREVLEAEYDFEIDRGKYLFNGSIDLIYKTGENEITILDYKYAKYDKDHIDGYTRQLYLYAAALKSMPEYKDYKIKEAITHFVLGNGQQEDYQHPVEITDEKINCELEGLDEVAEKINCGLKGLNNIDEKINISDYFPKNYDKCEKCSYRTFCVGKK